MRTLGFLPEPKGKSIFPDYSEGNSPYMEAFEKTEKEAKKLEIPKAVKDEWSEEPDADNYGKDSDAYKILSDLNSRWNSATVGEKAKYYSIAKDIRRLEKEGTPIKYAQDEIMNLLHENFLTKDKDDTFWVQYGIDLAEQGR